MSIKSHVFFPASRFQPENLDLGLQLASDIGFNVNCPRAPEPKDFYCGELQERATSFLNALEGPSPILWAARGGYGSIEWLDHIPDDPTLWFSKTFIGFSDLTALHAWCSNRNIPSIHGPMLATSGWGHSSPTEQNSLIHAIHHKKFLPIKIQGETNAMRRQGRLVGGNLTVLASLMGTPWELQLQQGDLLFLEDVNEPLYRLARALKQLSYSPNFHSTLILWGQVTGCTPSQTERHGLGFIEKLMKPYSNDWVWGLDCGHDRPNHSILLGTQAQLINDELSSGTA